ncbi:YicC family protein [Clostridium sp. MSJ-11]|uniref:YicC family protein n=1 Tax=Clostridium mobile TaxID=2841512 RepID=A0ABS6EBZ0_9CLOT|nr:YicC/YloC family endoribonuclease [Clostridium mobile]MBU5482719.1 YicC family protein [Clostridium mobile]
MIKSMTGFGRATYDDTIRSITVEIKSINHRYCDLNVKMPKSLISLEERIRSTVQEKIHRGKIDIFITLNTYDKRDLKPRLNKTLADNYYECLKEIKNSYEVYNDISISLIARFPEVITLQYEEDDIEELWTCLSNPLKEALNLLIQMREREGAKLRDDIKDKCDRITATLDIIKEKSPMVPIMYKEKLTSRINELLEDGKIDESRIAMEVAIFADKACIDEEIVRLSSHLKQVKDTLNLKDPVGRKLDFIVQEMNREANTIASKANNLDISNLALEIKNDIEKIREQIQNIE